MSFAQEVAYYTLKYNSCCGTLLKQGSFFDVLFGMDLVVRFSDNDICEVGLVLEKQFNYVDNASGAGEGRCTCFKPCRKATSASILCRVVTWK